MGRNKPKIANLPPPKKVTSEQLRDAVEEAKEWSRQVREATRNLERNERSLQ